MHHSKYRLAFVFFSIIVLFFTSCRSSDQKNTEKGQSSIRIEKQSPKFLYGINIDSLSVIRGKVKRNQFLADLLLPQGVSYATIDHLARHTRDVFDVRKIRKGHPYAYIKSKDSLPKLLYFAYEISPSHYVLYHLQDSVYAELGQKPITQKTKRIKGTIKNSLWMAVKDEGSDPNLAMKLSEIYAWTIDFFELEKGDSFKMIYPEFYVDGKYVGFKEITAANFIHKGENHYAFYFEQNGKGDYFDETGKSLERTFLKAPLKYRRISSRFTNHRWHPILKIYRPHHGVDYAAAEGTPVHSIGDGVIIKKGYQRNGAGNYLKIRHNGTYTTQYAHLRHYAKGMRVGAKVHQGQLIGYVGHTGLATGPHLDFRVYKFGRPINPLNLKSPPAKPIAKAYRPAFDSLVRRYKPLLDSL
jgi:murein DD-endopeptidase MepM/ murein hydrolase activator NlpD